MIRMNRRLLCVPIASLVLLGACGSDPEPQAAAASPPPPKKVAAAPAAPGDDTASMAKAVGDGKPGAAVNIRYEFRGKPAVGAPLDLEIAFTPNAGVDAMEAKISGMDGITVTGQLTPSFSQVEAGKPYRHTVSVLPDRAGVYYISVTVNTQIAGSSLARAFSIPFAVGNVPAQQKAEPAKDATGQPIESMKAEETTKK
jgi:hypothetical protein